MSYNIYRVQCKKAVTPPLLKNEFYAHISTEKKNWLLFRCKNDESTLIGLCLVTRVQLSLYYYLPREWHKLVGAAWRKFIITQFTKDVLLNLKPDFTGMLKKFVTNKNLAPPPPQKKTFLYELQPYIYIQLHSQTRYVL